MWIINAMFVASTGSANLPVPCEKQRPHICQMWSYYPTAELTDFEASYQWPAVNNHYLAVPCECRHQCLFLSFLGRHDCEKITGNMPDFRLLVRPYYSLAKRYVHDLYDVIKTVFLSLPAWHTRLFTDSIHNIRSILRRGNRRRKRLCNCLLTVRAPGPLPSSREPGASTSYIFRRIHTAHVRPELVVLTRKANVWIRREFLNFLAVFWISHHWSNSCTFSAGSMLRKKFPPTRLFLSNFGLSCAVRTTKFLPAWLGLGLDDFVSSGGL